MADEKNTIPELTLTPSAAQELSLIHIFCTVWTRRSG